MGSSLTTPPLSALGRDLIVGSTWMGPAMAAGLWQPRVLPAVTPLRPWGLTPGERGPEAEWLQLTESLVTPHPHPMHAGGESLAGHQRLPLGAQPTRLSRLLPATGRLCAPPPGLPSIGSCEQAGSVYGNLVQPCLSPTPG